MVIWLFITVWMAAVACFAEYIAGFISTTMRGNIERFSIKNGLQSLDLINVRSRPFFFRCGMGFMVSELNVIKGNIFGKK